MPFAASTPPPVLMAIVDSAAAETIDATSPVDRSNGIGPLRAAARGMVALVEGSSPHMSSETRDLLRHRLRIVAVIFFCAFSAFLLRSFSLYSITELFGPEWLWITVTHIAVATAMGIVAWMLCHRCRFSLSKLRLAEAIVFGAPAVFFVILDYYKLKHTVELPDGGAYVPQVVGAWMMLIYTYALFVPNTWSRALGILAPLGLAPLAVDAYLWFNNDNFRSLLQTQEFAGYLTEQAMIMGITVISSVLGVHTIRTLRQQAFAAKQLGQYHLKQKIGSGGMGEVYLAEHQMMKRPCAIKIIKPEKAGDPRILARFEREVRSTAKLSHWNSIDIYDYGNTADGTFYYVMEYLPGHNVGELVDMYGPLPAGRVVYLMDQVCKALTEAHGVGLVHRDLKPANIFCAYRGGEFDVAKLLDFGLAKPVVQVEDASLTQEGAVTGSPMFLSPEQATGEREADVRSDIYSLGAVMYFLLTGQPPFNYSQPVKLLIAHASENATAPGDIAPGIPEELDEIVLRCLEKDPDDRFQSIYELRRALESIDLDDPWSAERAEAWWSCNGCPERKRMAAELLEAAAV